MPIDEARVERELRQWVEEELAPILREGSLSSSTVASQILRELVELTRFNDEGIGYAPDQFTLSVHPEAALGLAGSFTDIHESISRLLEKRLAKVGYRMSRRLHVSLATDPTLAVGEIQVIAWHSGDPLKVTRELSPEVVAEVGRPPEDAFLMVAGKRHFALKLPQIRVGRLLENDLVLNDPHVSRRHALIRLEEGRYVLYDLRSTAGTRVNGDPIRSHRLHAGDVINFADVEVIYGQGPGRPPSEVLEYSPPEELADLREDTPLDLKSLDFPTSAMRKDDPDHSDQGTED